MKNVITYIVLIAILWIGICSQGSAQLVSEYADQSGYIARIGKVSLRSSRILINGNGIDIKLSSLVVPPPIPVLELNPNGNDVRVGRESFEYHGSALSTERPIDISGNGYFGTQGSFYIQLDDDASGQNESFEVLNSQSDVLFRVEEDNHYIKGDLFVQGSVLHDPETHYQHIHSSDIEVISDNGGNYEEDNGTYSDGSGNSYLGATIDVPHGASIENVTIEFQDGDVDGYMKFYLVNSIYSILRFGIDDVNPLLLYDGNIGFTSDDLQNRSISINGVTVDLLTSKYYIKILSDDWSEQRVSSITVEYTY